MRPTRLTRVQKDVVLWMFDEGEGKAIIRFGNKRVSKGYKTISGFLIIHGNVNLTNGLKNQRLSVFEPPTKANPTGHWRLTEKARLMISRMRKK